MPSSCVSAARGRAKFGKRDAGCGRPWVSAAGEFGLAALRRRLRGRGGEEELLLDSE